MNALRLALAEIDDEIDLDTQIAICEGELACLCRLRRDREDARWLRVLARAVQGHAFTSAELINHARLDPALHDLVQGLSARQVGKRLAQLATRRVPGFRLHRCVEKFTGWVWELRIQRGHGVDASDRGCSAHDD